MSDRFSDVSATSSDVDEAASALLGLQASQASVSNSLFDYSLPRPPADTQVTEITDDTESELSDAPRGAIDHLEQLKALQSR